MLNRDHYHLFYNINIFYEYKLIIILFSIHHLAMVETKNDQEIT